MKRLNRWRVFVFAGLVLCPSDGSAQAPYYAGKTITVIEGNSAGGVADLRTKSIMQFLQKYIPGNPTIVSQYVPGGGGRQRSEEHTSELQSQSNLVCRLLLEKKK